MSRIDSEPVSDESGDWRGWTQYVSGVTVKKLYGPEGEELSWRKDGWAHSPMTHRRVSSRPWIASKEGRGALHDVMGRIRTFPTAEVALQALRRAFTPITIIGS